MSLRTRRAGGAAQRAVERVAAVVAAVVAATRTPLGLAGVAWSLSLLAPPATVLGHGASAPAPEFPGVLGAWTFEPLPLLGVLAGLGLYAGAVARVDRAHPRTPVPRFRIGSWVAGLAVVSIALFSPVDTYATSLFSVHMVQHLLLTMVAAPLLALGAPITLLLRVAPASARRGAILPLLHSAPVRVLSFPVVAWLLFTAVMWASHFSGLFDAALEDPLVHEGEHLLYIVSGLLFWWPVVGADPSPWRMGYGARVGYLALGMPQNTFLGLAIYSAPVVLYPHYQTLVRAWGPDPLADQQLAGGLMWVVGDFLFIIPLLIVVAAWMRAEERRGVRVDAQLARERGVRREP
jgi:putative membrane protein